MSLSKWFRKRREGIQYVLDERRFAGMGLTRTRGEREYPREPGVIEGIAPDHIYRYEWAQPYCQGGSVFDYGCGVGYGSFFLSDKAAQVVGFDVSSQALAWARYYEEQKPNLSYTDRLPEAAFDCITCFECIEHVPNPEEVADWLAAHARRWVFISTPKAIPEGRNNIYHVREFTEEDFLDMLSSRFVIDGRETQQVPGAEAMLCRCRPKDR